jgi:predicted Zn-dependent peptidase
MLFRNSLSVALFMKEQIQRSLLPGGLVVISDQMPEAQSATLGFFCRLGARNEPKHLNGITHFIEHCVFKGTDRYTARELAALQDRLGGNLDAFTSYEETGFILKVTKDRFNDAFDLLAQLITKPQFSNTDCLTERNVITEEIKMNEDSPEELLDELFHKHFFPDHPLGLPITGTPESLSRFDSKTVADYHKKAFHPGNLIIAAAGNLEHHKLVELAETLDFPSNNGFSPADEPPQPAAPVYLESRPELEQTHLMLAMPLVSARDERRYAAEIFTGITGGCVSSRLWQKVREEHGLAYNIGASASFYSDFGFLTISAATSPESARDLLKIVVEELNLLVREGVTSDELELMKDQLRASILLGLEDTANRAATLAQFELVHGHQIPVEESLERIAAVSLDDIIQIAREFLITGKIALIAIGDLKEANLSRNDLEIRKY